MSNYNELVTILKELLFNRFYPKPEYIRGLLGDGRGNVLVPGRPDYNYVRFSRASTETFEVFNKEVSQPVDGWPILIGEFPWQPGLVQVVATDWSAYAQTGWGDSVASIQAHAPTHEWPNFVPGSDAINTYLRAITPMRTQAAGSGSTSVMVTAYEYDGQTGTNYGWPGSPNLNLAGATPPSGTMRYMGVYLNPLTNTLGVVSGSTTIYTDALEPDRPAWPRGVYPSAYVRLYGGQAAITERDVRDARRLWESTLIYTGAMGPHNLLSQFHSDTLTANVVAGDLIYGNSTPKWTRLPIVTGSYLGSGAGTPAWTHVWSLAARDGTPGVAWETDNDGNLKGATALDILPDNDVYGLWNRQVNYGIAPDEHWSQNTDEISWAGYAAYTGFVTPDTISTSTSFYRAAHSTGTVKAFRYRAAATGANIYIRSRVSITQICSAGIMIDDGVDDGDSEGATNFVRVYLQQATTATNAIQIVEQHRTGGGAVTTNTTSHAIPPGFFIGLVINSFGTLWTNWTFQTSAFAETGTRLVLVQAGSQTWTPARVGLYFAGVSTNNSRIGIWDWYDEATS
jgi:hypothetical protein